jgi:hypothetical protein
MALYDSVYLSSECDALFRGAIVAAVVLAPTEGQRRAALAVFKRHVGSSQQADLLLQCLQDALQPDPPDADGPGAAFVGALAAAAAFAPRAEEQRNALVALQRHMAPEKAGELVDALRAAVRPAAPDDHLEAGRRDRLLRGEV